MAFMLFGYRIGYGSGEARVTTIGNMRANLRPFYVEFELALIRIVQYTAGHAIRRPQHMRHVVAQDAISNRLVRSASSEATARWMS